ncbi:MAG: glycoside hydrolase family 28 protein [Bacteroides sp.]|nr:glycoside hydrolase family 28 protein [Bacteroides sp.]
MKSLEKVIAILIFLLPLVVFGQYTPSTYDIREFGAIGDGKTLSTSFIQSAIDSCAAGGGGTVMIQNGEYLTGTLYMKSHVNLYISAGSKLLGSLDYADYATDTYKQMYKQESKLDRCLIFAQNQHSFSIEGHGEIDGQGYKKDFPEYRPMLIRFMECSNIKMRDITLRNPASWTTAWLYCENIVVDGVYIHSQANGNGDGLDFDGCKNVRVSSCSFNTSDDCICLQASRPDKPCQDVVITNCIFETKWGGIRIGLLSRGDFESVTVSNCIFKNIRDSGLKIQMNEGGVMKNMVFSNLVMTNVPRPIFMTFCQQKACVDAPEEMAPMREMGSMVFDGIMVDNSMTDKNSVIFLSGMPGNPITHIMLSNIQMVNGGGGNKADASKRKFNEYTLETLDGWWPEFYGVGTLSAYGIYARHIDGLSLNNISIRTAAKDLRPALVLEDVSHVDVNNIKIWGNQEAESAIRFIDVQKAHVSSCKSYGGISSFLQIEGKDSKAIHISDNNNEISP